MFRRRLGVGYEASPRQTAKSNSEMIDRWMRTHVVKQHEEEEAPGQKSFDSSSHDMSTPILSNRKSLNEEKPEEKRDVEVGVSWEEGMMQRVVRVQNDASPLGIQVTAHYEWKKQPISRSVQRPPLIPTLNSCFSAAQFGKLFGKFMSLETYYSCDSNCINARLVFLRRVKV